MVVIRYTDTNEDENLSGERLGNFIRTMCPTIVSIETHYEDHTSFKSGTLIKNGYVLTCYHGFGKEKLNRIECVFYSEERKQCSLIDFDKNLDLAILKINEEPDGGFNDASFSESPPFQGQYVHRISMPNCLNFSYEHGNVSTVNVLHQGMQETTVHGMVGGHGSSGSSILNERGEIIGVSRSGASWKIKGSSGERYRCGNIVTSPVYEQLMSYVNRVFGN